jgi:hypothetical protein
MLAATALIYAAARYIGSQSLRRVAYVLLAMGLGFGWAQTRTYNEATQTGEAVFGRMQVSGMVEWHEAQARGSRWDIRLQDAQGRFFMVRLYGKQADLVRAQPGIESVVAIGTYFTAISGALWRPGASAAFTLPVAGLGFGVLCLVPNNWRFIGALPILIALFGVGQGARQALHMFGRDLIVARTAEAELFVLRQRGKQYELDRLARHHGLTPETLSCRPSCRLVLQDGVQLAYHDRSAGLTKSCREADVIIMPFAEARYPCRAQLFDSRAFKTRRHRQFAIKEGALTAQYMRRERLWERD